MLSLNWKSFKSDLSSSLSGGGALDVLVLYAAIRVVKSVMNSKIYAQAADKVLGWLSQGTDKVLPLVYAGLFPDFLIRYGIRIRLYDHLAILRATDVEQDLANKMEIVWELHSLPIAIETAAANEQHYEVPAKFYDLCLGPRKKYSSGLWPSSETNFEESELLMLDLYCERGQLEDGMKVVDLGCGWGSLTLHLAEKYPNCKVTAISNSHSQRDYIVNTAKERGYNLNNINVITCNVADDKGALDAVKDNDRVITIEMFEHMKNYDTLLKKIHGFLKPDGKLFVHIFSHVTYCYHFEKGWMSDTFFTGGTMPSDDLLLYFNEKFGCENHWRVCGTHYSKTSNGWLNMLDESWKAGELQPVLASAYGLGKEQEWYVNWRLFFLACAELFGLNNGQEWIVSHYLFQRR